MIHFYLGISSGVAKLQLNAGDENGIVNGNVDVADGQWHHVAGTWDGTNQIFYTDGNQDNTLTYIGNGQINDTDSPVIIGKTINEGGGPRYFSGVIDDISLYSSAITADEILGLYNKEN